MSEKITIPQIPLAERVRPKTLNDFRGQQKLVGPDGPLRKMIESDKLSSFILWGPPGSGKTTIAKIISNQTQSEFFQLNAVSSGVKDVRQVISVAKENLQHFKKTILFIDEIHRFNKSQQDALLAAVESGEIILIGATTENPSFEVIPPLRSRARVYILEELSSENITEIIDSAIKNDKFLSGFNITSIDYNYLYYISGGDARTLLNTIESAVIDNIDKSEIKISKEVIENVIQQKNIFYDKAGEDHYNVISAFIKSVRGSDPDASLYWLARMLEGGEDPLFIARRLIILASEDIGNASPNGLVLAEAAFGAVEKIGMPEARIILAQCVTYLAASPKSNASYIGIQKALSEVRNNKLYSVPLHLRNAPTNLMKEVGYGAGYKYPHDFDSNFISENYFPEEIRGSQYYYPTGNGMEKQMKERLKEYWKDLKKYL